MKTYLTLLCVLCMHEVSFAQNIFPASGNAAMGMSTGNNVLQINSAASPTNSQFRVTSNGLGGVSILSYAPNNSAINFGSDWSSGLGLPEVPAPQVFINH